MPPSGDDQRAPEEFDPAQEVHEVVDPDGEPTGSIDQDPNRWSTPELDDEVAPIDDSTGGQGQGIREWIRWIHTTDRGWIAFVREIVSSVLVVVVIGLLLFGISGVWPPMVAVESGSMEPHMHRGDLVFIMEEHRLAPQTAHVDTGVVTYQAGKQANYRKFGSYGDVIVFDPPTKAGPPIIHRARFWVETGENWYDKGDPSYMSGDSCREVPNCPAPHAGFITRGDANPTYDQVSGISGPVQPNWITGTAEVRIPLLGYIRLQFAELWVIESYPRISDLVPDS